MKMMGLPTGFMFDGYGHKQKIAPEQTRGFKKTFYCQTCKIELNSEDTMVSHMMGARHMLMVKMLPGGRGCCAIVLPSPRWQSRWSRVC